MGWRQSASHRPDRPGAAVDERVAYPCQPACWMLQAFCEPLHNSKLVGVASLRPLVSSSRNDIKSLIS